MTSINRTSTKIFSGLFATLLGLSCLHPARGQLFVLLPDSTITPILNGVATGPAEELTGSFTWLPTASGITGLQTFNLTSLSFESSSFSLSLDNIFGRYEPDTFSSGISYLEATVANSGSSQALNIYPSPGTFQGPYTNPTSIKDMGNLGPSSGGNYIARISIDAAVVPEPSTWAMLLGGLGLLAFWRMRTRRGRA